MRVGVACRAFPLVRFFEGTMRIGGGFPIVFHEIIREKISGGGLAILILADNGNPADGSTRNEP